LFSPFASSSIQVGAQAQDQFGWSNLLLGQLTAEWSALQHYYLTSISSCCTSTSWVIGIVTHLLAISHSIWVFCNCVVHYWTMDGLAHVAKLQVSEVLHTQFALGLQDLKMTLHQRKPCGLPSAHPLHGLPMLACLCCPCLLSRPAAVSNGDPMYTSCSPYLPSHPSPNTP